MRRRSKRGYSTNRVTGSSTHQLVKVRVAVPARLSSVLSRQILKAPPIAQRQKRSRTIRVPLLSGIGKTKLITTRVLVPRGNRPRAASMSVSKGRLSIKGRKYVEKNIALENSRRRRGESKRWRHRASTGYLDSTYRDTGILSANRNASAERLADAALVNSALGGSSWFGLPS